MFQPVLLHVPTPTAFLGAHLAILVGFKKAVIYGRFQGPSEASLRLWEKNFRSQCPHVGFRKHLKAFIILFQKCEKECCREDLRAQSMCLRRGAEKHQVYLSLKAAGTIMTAVTPFQKPFQHWMTWSAIFILGPQPHISGTEIQTVQVADTTEL